MRKLLLAVVGMSWAFVAGAQSPKASAFTGTAPAFTCSATSGDCFKLKQGADICYNSTTCTATQKYDGTNMVFAVPTGKGFSFKVNGTQYALVDNTGLWTGSDFYLTGAGKFIYFNSGTTSAIGDSGSDIRYYVPTGGVHDFRVNNVSKLTLSSTVATFAGSLTMATGQFLNLNVGGTTYLQDSSGNMFSDVATGQNHQLAVNGTAQLTVSGTAGTFAGNLRFNGASLTSGASGTTTWTLTNSASTGLLIVPTTQLTSGTLFEVDNPSATNALKVSWDKNLTIGNHIIAGGDVYSGSGFFNVNTSNTSGVFAAKITDGAGAVAHKFANQSTLTAGSDRYIAYFYRDDRSNLMAKIDTNGQGTFNGGVVFSSGGTAVTKHITNTSVIDFASTNAGACTSWSSAVTVTGAALGDRCHLGTSADPTAVTGQFSCQVTAADTAKAIFCSGAASQDPASMTYTFEVWH